MIHLKTLVIFMILFGFKPSYAQNDPEILQIYDRFITSGVVTGKCDKPDKKTLKHFFANLQIISDTVSKQLKETYPEYTEESISVTMKKRKELITQKVNEMIENKGCSDPDIKAIINRFHVQAKWKPGPQQTVN